MEHCRYIRLPVNDAYSADFTSCYAKALAQLIDMTDKVIYDAIIATAIEEGITDLYLLDKQFVIEALREKLKREKEKDHVQGIQ